MAIADDREDHYLYYPGYYLVAAFVPVSEIEKGSVRGRPGRGKRILMQMAKTHSLFYKRFLKFQLVSS